ncbi:MAG TPA: hypothetical protein VLG11_02320 [Candidatus Saccharimonadales bacterium]|nr:hypothetical protein [Candidatus Saccharimonadales bacterium]
MKQPQPYFEHIEHLKQTVESAAQDLAPAVVLRGSAGPHTVQIDPESFSEALETRVQVELAVNYLHREVNDESAATDRPGLYRSLGDNWDLSGVLGTHEPLLEERALAETIDRLLLKRRGGGPVVALDFGGGYGLSWLRVAAQPAYRAAIEEGRLAMAVTNLGSISDQSIDADGYSGIAGQINRDSQARQADGNSPTFTPADLQWVQDNQARVQYLDTSALELAHTPVGLADGGAIDLAGNVGIIHEDNALSHSHTPDLAMANFKEILTEDGVLSSSTATYYHAMQVVRENEITLGNGRVVPMNEAYARQRRLSLIIGSKMLQQVFSYQHDVRRHRGIFSHAPDPQAPRVPFKCGRILP